MSLETEPIIVRIESRLFALLESVTTTNGYQVDIKPTRKEPSGNEAPPGTVLLAFGDSQDDNDRAPLQHDGFAHTFTMHLFAAAPERAETSADILLMQMESAIRKAIGEDMSYTLGGYVHDFRFDDSRADDTKSLPCRQLQLTVFYRTLRGNPYER